MSESAVRVSNSKQSNIKFTRVKRNWFAYINHIKWKQSWDKLFHCFEFRKWHLDTRCSLCWLHILDQIYRFNPNRRHYVSKLVKLNVLPRSLSNLHIPLWDHLMKDTNVNRLKIFSFVISQNLLCTQHKCEIKKALKIALFFYL